MSRWNGENQPLEVWVRDKQEWQGWQEYRPARNDFNRPFIFSLMQFYHESDIWMFGGVYRVSRRRPDAYEVELTDEGAGLIGRLKLRSPYRERATRVKFENYYSGLEVQEVLREPYSGRSFPRFEDIDLCFEELETLVRNSRPDWKAALVSDPSFDYCRQWFRFALLESRPAPTPDTVILERETFWKRILLSRDEQGLNRN